jgi:proteasome lid subunit RPN8/RPN11
MIHLSAELCGQIRAEGERLYPEECCGLLLGSLEADRARKITLALPAENTREAEKRRRRFLMEADDFMRAEAEARRRGIEILGFYHSHPDHPAVPSEYDREHALPCFAYLILAVRKGVAGELSGWELAPDRSVFLARRILFDFKSKPYP